MWTELSITKRAYTLVKSWASPSSMPTHCGRSGSGSATKAGRIPPSRQSFHRSTTIGCRWRQIHGVTWRTVNLRYKIPRKTFLSRLRVFWSNCIIVRALHRLLHPGKDLHFAGFDQKPLWFNSILAEKTLSTKGRKKIGVAENVSSSRARFTHSASPLRSELSRTESHLGATLDSLRMQPKPHSTATQHRHSALKFLEQNPICAPPWIHYGCSRSHTPQPLSIATPLLTF